MLSTIDKKYTTPKKARPSLPATPITCKAVRRAQRAFQANPTHEKAEKAFRALERMAAQHEIDEHEKRGLEKALKMEKKKRQRGKRLNLLGEEDNGP